MMNASSIHTAPCVLRGELHPSLLPSAAEENPPHDLLSMADFLRTVGMLGRELSKPVLGDVLAAFVVCSYDTWKQTFGEPRDIQECRGVVSCPPVDVWEQACSEGVVHCVGHILDDPHNGQMVILTRVCLF
jgi:hypothetical protein